MFLCVLNDELFTPEDELYMADGQMDTVISSVLYDNFITSVASA